MINVLKKLAELDSGNPNVANPLVQIPIYSVAEGANSELPQLPELHDLSTLKALSGLKKIDECGMMPDAMGMGHSTPASFSLNASAASGDEVANMLTQIMNLAGVHQVGPSDMPALNPGASVLTAEPTLGGDDSSDQDDQPDQGASDGEVMRSMIDKMNPPEDESVMAGGDSPVASMADEVRGMADELASTDKDELGLESYDNTPNSPFNVGPSDTNAHAYQPNLGTAAGRGFANNPRATTQETIAQELFSEYRKFVSEAEEKTMSRAAKGYMKYGKKGMKALADAGREGKDLEPIQDKFNKYKEGYNPNSVDAEHRRSLEKSHEDSLKKKADDGDESAKKRLQALKDKKERMRNDYNDRMER